MRDIISPSVPVANLKRYGSVREIANAFVRDRISLLKKPELVVHRFRDGFQQLFPVHDSFHLCHDAFYGLQYG